MTSTVFARHNRLSLAGAIALALGLSAVPLAPLGAQTPAKASGKPWVAPRTPDGQPDFQGNWSNETQTPLERMGKGGPTLTDAQAAALEKRAQDVEEFRDRPTEPGETATKDNGTYELAAVPGDRLVHVEIAPVRAKDLQSFPERVQHIPQLHHRNHTAGMASIARPC